MTTLDPSSPLAMQAAQDVREIFAARRGAALDDLRDQESWDQVSNEVITRIVNGVGLGQEQAEELGLRIGMYFGAWGLLTETLHIDAIILASHEGKPEPWDGPDTKAELLRRKDAALKFTYAQLVADQRTII